MTRYIYVRNMIFPVFLVFIFQLLLSSEYKSSSYTMLSQSLVFSLPFISHTYVQASLGLHQRPHHFHYALDCLSSGLCLLCVPPHCGHCLVWLCLCHLTQARTGQFSRTQTISEIYTIVICCWTLLFTVLGTQRPRIPCAELWTQALLNRLTHFIRRPLVLASAFSCLQTIHSSRVDQTESCVLSWFTDLACSSIYSL